MDVWSNVDTSPQKPSSTTIDAGDCDKSDSKVKLQKEVEDHFTKFIDLILKDENIPKNILLVGSPAAGKSSFINLLKSALLGHYSMVAQPGASHSGAVNQFTDQLTKYCNMGLNKREMASLESRIRNSERYVPPVFRLPTLIDIPGIENDPEFILDLIMDGLVPDRANLTTAMKFDTAPITDYTCASSNRIDLIVFVASISQDVPCELFEKVFNLAYRKKNIPFTLVITHTDCTEIAQSTFESRRKQIEDILCISQDNIGMTTSLSNYNISDPIDPEQMLYRVNLKKHKAALITMQMMIRWRLPRLPPKPIEEWEVHMRIFRKFLPKIADCFRVLRDHPLIVGIMVVLIVAFIIVDKVRAM